jgi:hypothetical protein
LLTSRSFLLGLALQVPFALLAWGIAATLGAVARTMGEALRDEGPARAPARTPFAAAWPLARSGRPHAALDPARALRAPPVQAPLTA